MKIPALITIFAFLLAAGCEQKSETEQPVPQTDDTSINADELLRAVGGTVVKVILPDSHTTKDGFSLVRDLSDGTTEAIVGSFWPHQEAGSEIRMSIVPTRTNEIRIVLFTLDGTSIASSHKWGDVDWAVFPDAEERWGKSIMRFYSREGVTIPSEVIRKAELSSGEFDLRLVTVKPNEG